MKSIIAVMLFLAFIFAVGWGLWMFDRHVHYKLAYETMVEQTVRGMVRPEALK